MLILRRVPDMNPDHQSELFTVYRGLAIIEQVIADLKNRPLAHLASGSFPANSTWLVLAAIARRRPNRAPPRWIQAK